MFEHQEGEHIFMNGLVQIDPEYPKRSENS